MSDDIEATMQEGRDVGTAFEKKHGSNAFLKTACSSLARLLVAKGIVTDKELIEGFIHETEIYEVKIASKEPDE